MTKPSYIRISMIQVIKKCEQIRPNEMPITLIKLSGGPPGNLGFYLVSFETQKISTLLI
jgi:hypothetical protein